MKRYTRKMPSVAKGQRRQRKSYDEGDEFEGLDYGPGDPYIATPDRAAQSTQPKS